jgi:hypothetical protein
MTMSQGTQAGVAVSAGDRLKVEALCAVAAVAAVVALVSSFRLPDDMLPVILLYAIAGAAGVAGIRFARSRRMSANGCKLVVGTTVLALLVTVSLWTLLDTWSTIGRCERREAVTFGGDVEVWHEGTSCTDEQREHRYEYN